MCSCDVGNDGATGIGTVGRRVGFLRTVAGQFEEHVVQRRAAHHHVEHLDAGVVEGAHDAEVGG